MKKNIIFFMLLFFASACCKKGVTTYITDPEIISAGTFKVGTYYIYRDSITGVEDSIWVVDYNRAIYDMSSNYYKSDSRCFDKTEQIRTIFKSISDTSINISYINTTASTSYSNIGYLLNKPFIIDEVQSNPKGYIKNINFYPNYNFINNNYQNVYHRYNKMALNNVLNDSLVTNTYYSSYSGLVKFSIQTDTSYVVKELIRSNIIK